MKSLTVTFILLFSAQFLSAGAESEVAQAPTPKAVQKSLTNQVQSSGVRIEYTYQRSDFPNLSSTRIYQRSSRMQYHQLPKAWSTYDRKENIGRVAYYSEKNNFGIVENRIGANLNQSSLPEPILYNMANADLLEAIGAGKIHETPESIDGNSCWRIDIEGIRPDSTYEVWVDPNIAFMPRKIVSNHPQQTITATFKDYKEFKEGLWYPMTMHWEVDDSARKIDDSILTITINVTKIEAIDPLASFHPKFPSGTKVTDISGEEVMEYVVP